MESARADSTSLTNSELWLAVLLAGLVAAALLIKPFTVRNTTEWVLDVAQMARNAVIEDLGGPVQFSAVRVHRVPSSPDERVVCGQAMLPASDRPIRDFIIYFRRQDGTVVPGTVIYRGDMPIAWSSLAQTACSDLAT